MLTPRLRIVNPSDVLIVADKCRSMARRREAGGVLRMSGAKLLISPGFLALDGDAVGFELKVASMACLSRNLKTILGVSGRIALEFSQTSS